MRPRLPWLVLTSLSLLVLAPTAPASVERGSKLFLWKASSPTTEVYLFGSIHLGKPEWYPLAKEIEDQIRVKLLPVKAQRPELKSVGGNND